MRVSIPRLEASPRDGARQRLTARVTYDDRKGPPEDYWLDLPPETGADAAASGNPWLVALLPLAATLGGSLEIEAPVDTELLGNVREVLRIWRRWYPHVRPVELRCEIAEPATLEPEVARRAIEPTAGGVGRDRAPGTAALFSGGVDSFFTLLRPRHGLHPTRAVAIDHFVTIHGFDIPLDRDEAFSRLSARVCRIAAETGCVPLRVATNLRETRWSEADWGRLGHGCALAAVCHALDGVVGTVLVPSGAAYEDAGPWASHPITDPLLSSSRLRVIHDGASADRVEKLELLAGSPMALRELRVCFRSETDENCGVCPKCVRTMLTLELLGASGWSAPFGGISEVPVHEARRLYCRWPWDFVYTSHIMELARARGRPDVERALRAAMNGSRRRNRALERMAPLRETRALAWAPRLAERALLPGWVR